VTVARARFGENLGCHIGEIVNTVRSVSTDLRNLNGSCLASLIESVMDPQSMRRAYFGDRDARHTRSRLKAGIPTLLAARRGVSPVCDIPLLPGFIRHSGRPLGVAVELQY
jgi:hypothetical protein